MFSNEHLNKIKELAAKNGDRNPSLGKVLVSGNYKKFTHMTNDPESYSRRYSDARIVVAGDIRKIKYETE
jgi:hypothetical protein